MTGSDRQEEKPSRWPTPCTENGCGYLGIAALVDRENNVYWQCLKHAGIDDDYDDYGRSPYSG